MRLLQFVIRRLYHVDIVQVGDTGKFVHDISNGPIDPELMTG